MNQLRRLRLDILNISFFVIFILLAIQYILGMFVNLFVQFPASLPNGNAWGWSLTNTMVIPLHVAVGLLLILCALIALIVSICTCFIPQILLAVVGLAMIIYAWLSGALFLSNGQQNADSFQMSLGFIGAIIAYSLGLWLAQSERRSALDGMLEDSV